MPGRARLRRSGLLLAGLVLTVAACGTSAGSGGTGGSAQPTAYVEGVVTAGPQCPVQRAERPCPPRPVPGARVELLDGATVVASGRTDQNGRYRLSGPAGELVVRATNVGGYRSTAEQTVRLASGATATVPLRLDTGIR